MVKLSLQSNSSTILTPQDLRALTMEIRLYARWFSQANIKNRVSGQALTEELVISDTAAKMIKQAAANKPVDNAVLDDLITALDELAATAPCITITLAAMPGNGLKKSLVQWCRTNIEPGILVDFRFNATILGGMVVQYGSHVYDWSFRRQIMANRANFPGVLRRV